MGGGRPRRRKAGRFQCDQPRHDRWKRFPRCAIPTRGARYSKGGATCGFCRCSLVNETRVIGGSPTQEAERTTTEANSLGVAGPSSSSSYRQNPCSVFSEYVGL